MEEEYVKKLLSENIEYHNRNVCYRIILEKHNLLGEAEDLLKSIFDETLTKEKEELILG